MDELFPRITVRKRYGKLCHYTLNAPTIADKMSWYLQTDLPSQAGDSSIKMMTYFMYLKSYIIR